MMEGSFTFHAQFAFGHGGDHPGYEDFMLKQFDFASILLTANMPIYGGLASICRTSVGQVLGK
jgi:hypothetical protein